MSVRRVFRWILYFLELIAVYVLQTTPGIIPAVSGARPVLLIPAALTIAMFEGDIGGMTVGIAAGLLIDMGGSDILGFHAIVLAILCFVLGSMTMQIFRTNLLVALLASFVAVPVVIVLQWVFFYILPGYGDLQYVFLGSLLPKMVYTFALGSRRLYDFLDHNQTCMIAPVDYVADPAVIAQHEKMISINACLQVDLYGQVCSESIGFSHISGQGGQMCFVEGAFRSPGGKSFLCTASTKTKKDGSKESLIVPFLPPGGIVSAPRYATQYVVTEYGMVNLKCLSTWERAEALIGIAHPDFREDLIRQAEAQGIWKNSSKLL